MLIEIEAEAIIGAARTRRDIYTEHQREKPRGYARAVEIDDRVYVSGCTSINPSSEIEAVGDWAAQSDVAHRAIEWALGQAGATLDDVVRRRTFTVAGAHVNRYAARDRRGCRQSPGLIAVASPARPARPLVRSGWPRSRAR
jgi:enamine deaminase RidA (YjgF/YER057c/UK114 family)